MSPPNSAVADRNLLFGILALQLEFLGRDTLIAALHAWVLDKSKPLGQILADQGQLTAERRQLLEALVDEHVKAHQDNPQQSLAALSLASALGQELQQIADPDVQAGLAQVTVGADSQAAGTASYHWTGAPTPGLRYRVLRPHAKGGLGEVFVAEDTELHREVALKEIRPEHVGDAGSRGRFVLEAEITGGLEHPGIVPVYGLGTYDDGRPFYAMRFIRGDNLKEAIQRFHQAEGPRRDPGERNVAFRELLGRFVDVCNAVAYAHSRGILHRDLKPGNIMLGKYGETLVVDWGLAKAVGRPETLPDTGEAALRPSSADSNLAATRQGSAIGTPAFMSPEQAAGRLDLLGPAADVYSLGATLYAVLTGTAPFRGAAGDILRQVQRGEFPPPRQVKADVPVALAAVCSKAMALRPDQRYGTALALAEDVEHWLADEPVSAWPEPVTVKLGRWARQHKPVVSGAAAALLVGLLAAGAGLWWYQQNQAARYAAQVRQEEQAKQEVSKAVALRQQLQQQLAQEGGVRQLLNEPAHWAAQLTEAKLHLEKAEALLVQAGEDLDLALNQQLQTLTEQLQQDEADRSLAVRLEQIRMDRSAFVEGKFNHALAVRAYPLAFAEAKLDVVAGEPAQGLLTERLRRSAIKEQLVAALDDWAFVAWLTGSRDLTRRLLALARLADPDPWRDRMRDPATWKGPQAVQQLAAELLADQAALARQSPQLLDLLGHMLSFTKGDAADWLRQAQTHHPTDFWLSFDLANTVTEAKPGEAAGYYRAALAVRPRSTVAWNNLGATLANQQDLPGAVVAYRKAVHIDPKYAMGWNNLGLALKAQQKLPGAVDAYRKALHIDPRYALAWANLGNALTDQKNLPAAVAAYEKALAIDPQDDKAWNNLGFALSAQQKLSGAVAAYQKALAINPQHTQAWNNLGNALHAQKDLPGAIDAFQKALSINPHYARAWNNLGTVLRDKKDLPGAIDAFQKALSSNPQFVQAWNNLGITLRAQKNLPGAVTAFQKAVSINPQYPQAWYNLGVTLRDNKDLPGSVDAFRKFLTINPHDAKAWINLGVGLFAQKDLPGAVAAYRKALAVAPNLVQAHSALGRALLDQGEFAQAHETTRHALQLLPQGHPERGLVQKQLQQCQQALRQEQRALDLLQGQAASARPPELLQLAQFCRQYHRPYTAARLYAAAFAAQPGLAADLAKGRRFQAAAAAALAAAGQGKDAEKLVATAKANLRQQALDWLRADLKLFSPVVTAFQDSAARKDGQPGSPLEKLLGQAQQPGPADLLRVCDRLQRWQTDPDLVSLRADKELAKLPAAEQDDWQQLWADVQALKQQARACFTERRHEGHLTAQHKEQVQEVKLQAGKTCVFDLASTAFNAVLRLEDDKGKKLAENHDVAPGVNRNARIVFTPQQDGVYRLVATAFQGQGTGAYVLRIREFAVPRRQQPTEKGTKDSGTLK